MDNYVLEILDGDRAGDVLPLTDRPLRIGRKPSNELVLTDEKTSGVHAEVVAEGGRHVLRDLGSTNGTFLDEKRVHEVVLSSGDVVTIGRLRIRYVRADELGAGAGAGAVTDPGLAVHTLDASRVGKRGGSVGLLLALVGLVGGAAGYWWWQGQGSGDEGASRTARQAELQVPGNKLLQAVAGCEAEEGWNLRLAGAGFQATGAAHSGKGAFQALRGDAAEAPDFAVAGLSAPMAVLSGRTLTLQARVRTEGAGQAAVHAVFGSAGEGSPFSFRHGTALAAAPNGWQEQAVVVTVPPGCDRMQIELVAALGDAAAAVTFDDVAVLEAGQAAVLESKLSESSQTAIGTGSALAIRSNDPDNPATLLAVLPAAVPKPLEGLQRAGYLALSDLGASLACESTERSFKLQATGVSSLQFTFPAESAAGLLVRGGTAAAFTSTAADAPFTAQSLLLGHRLTRAQALFAAPANCSGQTSNGLYRLTVDSAAVELVLGFRAERLQAREFLQKATQAQEAGRPGEALDTLRTLAGQAPHDSELLGQAQVLRSTLLAAQAEVLKQLQQDLADAQFFDTRGGFQRVDQGVDLLLARYGEGNLDDAAAVQRLREAARARLQEVDSAQQGAERTRLEALGKALGEAQQTGLAEAVRSYVERHLGGGK